MHIRLACGKKILNYHSFYVTSTLHEKVKSFSLKWVNSMFGKAQVFKACGCLATGFIGFWYNFSGGVLDCMNVLIAVNIYFFRYFVHALWFLRSALFKIYFLFCFQVFIKKSNYKTLCLLIHTSTIVYSILSKNIWCEIAIHFHFLTHCARIANIC